MRSSVERAAGAALWVALTTLAALSVTDYWGTAHFLATTEQVNHAHQVLDQLDLLLAQVTDAETGQRGYLLTGASRYLEPYERAVAEVADTLDSLRTTTAGDEAQRDRISRLTPLVVRRLALLRSTMDVRTRDGFEAARRMMSTDGDEDVMDAIRTLVGETAGDERRILADRSRAARQGARRTIVIVLGGDLVAFLLAAACNMVAIRGLAGRKRHEAALESARRRAEAQADELRALARALDEARQAAQGASRLKSEFLANVSHEIRTPMAAILGYTELLADPATPDRKRADAIEIIRRNGDHLIAVINDVLDLSKIEAGKLVVERIPCSPFDVVAEVTSLMRSRAEAKGLAFDVAYRTPIPETVTTDPTRLRQILINLIGNAIKFTPSGSVRVELALEAAASPRLVIAVVDTGIGLAPEEQARIFGPFAQADASTTRRFGGTGLGLAISKRLAEMLGGEIDVVSTPARGSTFSLAIDPGPLDGVAMAVDRPREPAPAPEAREEPAPRLAGRILVAEDGPDNRQLIAFHLRAAGASVMLAADGLVACELVFTAALAGTPFDLILMDVQMPGLDGYAATRRLRAGGYRGPIIALTAHVLAADRERCLEAGCVDFATKPIARRALLDLVRRHLPARNVAPPIVSDVADDRALAEVLAAFVRRLPDRLAAMEQALGHQDLESLAMLAHQMRGAASGYGFPAITEAAAALESAAKTHGQVERRLADLALLCRRARAEAEPL
jgi:signal transduction histidine kinase/DNA-binding response OmpR family regulator